ncbi:hypothetical protein U91I_03301 [alpha proteobacterium U9-1i]|nr:hypothetical protein U91I_03301 [alpha proteobacterium U9-1i]
MRILLFVGLAAIAAACSRATATEEVRAPAAFSVVNECDARFVELLSQDEPREMRWGRFGDVVDQYYGVDAYSHGQEDEPRRSDGSGRYQCTELIHRYLREVHHVPSRLGLGLGNGVDLAEGVASRWGGQAWSGGLTGETPISLRYYEAGVSICRPTIGAIVSFSMGRGPGHVAIIRALHEENGALIATLFEQHGGGSYQPDEMVRAGHVRFVRDENGAWNGIYTTDWGGTYPVKGWTNFVVL